LVGFGAEYDTLIERTDASGVVAVTSAGQEITGGCTGTQSEQGAVGLLWHAITHRQAAKTTNCRGRMRDKPWPDAVERPRDYTGLDAMSSPHIR
jgi:hypothetical protein